MKSSVAFFVPMLIFGKMNLAMKRISVLILSAALPLLVSCSNEPRRKVAGPKTPDAPEVASDGRISPRNSAENKKRLEHYNNLQHR
jgi:hypothetical protein